jgi:hypothetical protein
MVPNSSRFYDDNGQPLLIFKEQKQKNSHDGYFRDQG